MKLIRRTLKLAQRGAGYVNPNPMVGAVIVRDGQVLSEGFHKYFGGKHAEVEAIEAAPVDLKGSTIYVNLEPCSHFGKQPPCVHKIINAGIKKVVIGTSDPNPLVNGQGIRFLRENGVEVTAGVIEVECRRLNEVFFKFVKQKSAFVTLKVAQTLDGKIAAPDGSSKWITSEKSRKLVHKIRAQADVILVGVGTILSDNPGLDVRHRSGRNPIRVILDTNLRIPVEAKVLNDSRVWETVVVTQSDPGNPKYKQIQEKGAQILEIPVSYNKINLHELLKMFAQKNYSSILVEGGSQVFSSFLREELVDRLSVFVAPKILGNGLPCFQEIGIKNINDSLLLENLESKKIGSDYFFTGRILERN